MGSTNSPSDSETTDETSEHRAESPATNAVQSQEESNCCETDCPNQFTEWLKKNTKPNDWIQAATLVVVAFYTGITYCTYRGSLESSGGIVAGSPVTAAFTACVSNNQLHDKLATDTSQCALVHQRALVRSDQVTNAGW